MWMFWNVPEFCGGDSEFSKTNPFFVFSNVELNNENYIESVAKSLVFVTSHIQDIISNYHIKARQFLFRLKQDYFQNYRPK